MKSKTGLQLVILCLSMPVCFLEGQANVEFVLCIIQSTVVYNPLGVYKTAQWRQRENRLASIAQQAHAQAFGRKQPGYHTDLPF